MLNEKELNFLEENCKKEYKGTCKCCKTPMYEFEIDIDGDGTRIYTSKDKLKYFRVWEKFDENGNSHLIVDGELFE